MRVTILIGLLLLAVGSGCKTVYHSVAVTEASVDTAMKTWGSYVAWCRQHPEEVPVADLEVKRAKVKTAYEQYRKSMNAVYDIRRTWEVTENGKTKMEAALETAALSAPGVIDVINSFLPVNWRTQ